MINCPTQDKHNPTPDKHNPKHDKDSLFTAEISETGYPY